jgi:hypothetical protein
MTPSKNRSDQENQVPTAVNDYSSFPVSNQQTTAEAAVPSDVCSQCLYSNCRGVFGMDNVHGRRQ